MNDYNKDLNEEIKDSEPIEELIPQLHECDCPEDNVPSPSEPSCECGCSCCEESHREAVSENEDTSDVRDTDGAFLSFDEFKASLGSAPEESDFPSFDDFANMAVGEEERENETPAGSQYTYYDDPEDIPVTPVKKKRGGFWKKLLSLLLSAACGFAGAWSYSAIFGTRVPVIYQSADTGVHVTQEISLADMVEKCKPSVVEINTEILTTSGFFEVERATAAGSGVVLTADGYIITNYHVINDANTVNVITSDGKVLPAKVYGYDQSKDVALIKVNATDLVPAVIADSSTLRVGDFIFAIGNPLGTLGGSVTEGVVSALDRDITVEGQKMKLMQISAAVNPGNSGGGLFNSRGELVGIVNAKSTGEDIEGIGFAIASNVVTQTIEAIMENGGSNVTPSGPVLGITVVDISTNEMAQQYNVTRLGVYIVGITEGMGAEEAGLQVGDYIISIDDNAVSTTPDLTGYLANCSEGQKVRIQVIRNNRMLIFEVELRVPEN